MSHLSAPTLGILHFNEAVEKKYTSQLRHVNIRSDVRKSAEVAALPQNFLVQYKFYLGHNISFVTDTKSGVRQIARQRAYRGV